MLGPCCSILVARFYLWVVDTLLVGQGFRAVCSGAVSAKVIRSTRRQGMAIIYNMQHWFCVVVSVAE